MARFSLLCFSLLLVLLGLSAVRASAAPAASPATPATPAAEGDAGASGEAGPTGRAGETATEAVRAEEIVVETEILKPAEIYQDTPVETEILTEEDLEALPALDAIEALEALPGVRITSQVQGQRGAVRIDGLPPEFTEILVNGQRYSGETGEAIDLGDQLFANLQRVEILRGPQALRYTSRAGGGVINFVTKPPPTSGASAEGLAGAGDQDRISSELNLGWGNERLGGVLTYDFNRIGGFKSPDRGSDDPDDGLPSTFGEGSLLRVHDVYSTFVARPAPSVEWTAHLGYRLRNQGFRIDDGPLLGRRKNERWLFTQELRFELASSTQLYNTFTFSYDDQDSTVGREFKLIDDFTRYESRLEHVQPIGPTLHVLTAGIDLSTNGIELEDGPVPDSIENDELMPSRLDERQSKAAGYVVLESELQSWLRSEIGVRYQTHEDFKPELLPQAALLIEPWRWDAERAVKIRLSAGRAARFPALRERFQPPSPQNGGAYFLAGSEDLEPEKVWALRGSIEANPRRWISASVAGFYSSTTNRIRAFDNGDPIQIGTNVIPANPRLCDLGQIARCTDSIEPVRATVFASRNLDDLESFGVEARLKLRPNEWTELSLGYTWNRTRVTDSNIDIDELPNSPRHVVNGRLRLTMPVVMTGITLRGTWRDRAIIEQSGTGLLSFATNEESNTSFEMDLRVTQPLEKWLGRQVEVFADVKNVTDNRVINSNVVRGRSFFAGVRASFP